MKLRMPNLNSRAHITQIYYTLQAVGLVPPIVTALITWHMGGRKTAIRYLLAMIAIAFGLVLLANAL